MCFSMNCNCCSNHRIRRLCLPPLPQTPELRTVAGTSSSDVHSSAWPLPWLQEKLQRMLANIQAMWLMAYRLSKL